MPRRSLLVAALTALCIVVTLALFDRAYPLVDVGLRLGREEAVARARALAARDRLAPTGARAAARFESNDTLSTYVDLAAGGPDSLRALVRGKELAVYTWAVRLFEPGSPRETVVRFAPDGRLVGVDHSLAQDERRPLVSDSAGRAAADAALARWGAGDPARWRFVSASYVTRPRSGRVDRTYTYERVAGQPGARVGAAPVRAEVTVTGDSSLPSAQRPVAAAPLGLRVYAQIPEAFRRRYGEMRSANDFLASLTVPAMGIFLVAAIVALVKLRPTGIRWRPAVGVGAVVGALFLVTGLDQIPGAWFDYDTATSPTTFVAQLVLGAVAASAGAGLFVAGVIAAAEALTRRAFPRHYDWWGYWRHRGAPPIARRVLGGYALAAFGFAYVTLFYVATRALLGWWVPAGTLDDPNQIASPFPWATALGLATFAGTWEESIFRAVPLALLTLWASRRAHPRRWLAAGVVVTALVFGFGHANYQSWPAYSRGAELFLEAALWAVLYVRVGLPTTIVAHALYDLTWFGLFSLHGRGTAYRVTFAVVLAALLLPALAVAQGWLARRRALAHGAALPAPPRLGDWRPAPLVAAEPTTEIPVGAGRRAAPIVTRAAAAVALLALLVRLLWLRPTPLGPPFAAARARVTAAADSAARALGADPTRLRRLVTTDGDAHDDVRRFLDRSEGGRAAAARTLAALAATYLPTSWWSVRYVRTAGAVAERAEEWRVRVLPDGRVLDVLHVVPEAQPGAAPSPDSARAVARRALAAAGVAQATLREADLEQTPRPARLDTRVEYDDASARLPAGASARVRVALAGDRAVAVRRIVRLPETFERAERERASRRALVLALAGIGLFGLVVGLVVTALRRPLLPDAPRLVDRRVGLALGAGAAAASVAAWVNGLPAILAAWRTEEPWSTYLAQAALSAAILAGATAVIVAALWTLTDALRRRTAIPFWPSAARPAALHGAALGIGVTTVQFLVGRLGVAGWPVPRATAAGELLPWAGGALGVLPTALVAPTTAIAGIALAVAARRPAARWGALALAAACVATIAGAGADRPAESAAGAVAALAAVVGLVRWFGAGSGASWVFAALAAVLAASLRGTLGGETTSDATSAILGALTAALLAWVLWRACARHAGDGSM